MDFKLNPANDVGKLARQYAKSGRMQVKNIFTEETAEEIYRRLMGVDWWLTYNEGSEVHQMLPEHLRALSPQDGARIQQQIYSNARKGYQFLYNHYPLFAAYFSTKFDSMPLFPVYEFINSPPVLDFFRQLTGLPNVRWADGHATLFRATHFLKGHTDLEPKEQRLAAYVLNFTKEWDTDWGGLLQFWDKDGNVELAFKPTFNALNIFTIPADHSVSMVTPYSPGLRFSITGWLRGDEPPGSFTLRSDEAG